MSKRIKYLVYLFAIVLTCLFSVTTYSVFAGEDTSVTVSFYLDEEKTDLYQTQTVEVGSYVDIPETPNKDDNVFVCWNIDGTSNKFAFNTPVDGNGDIALVAVWEQVVFNVTFKVGEKIVSQQKVEKNGSAIPPATVDEYLNEGQTFTCWDVDFSNVTGNLTVNAVLGKAQYSIPVIYTDGSEVNTFTLTKEYGDTVTIDELVAELNIPEHYSCETFEFISDEILPPVTSVEIKGNGIIRLVYTPEKLNATFKVEGSESLLVSFNAYSTVPYKSSPVKEGYIFIGWYVDGTDELFDFTTPCTENITLEAKFISIEKTKYDVIFYDGFGNQYGGVQKVEEGGSAIEPGSPYMEGYEFVRWDSDFTNVTENISVYPIYSVNTYQVTFVGYGGEQLKTVSVRYGESVSESSVPTPSAIEGKEFICWDNSYKNIKQDTVVTATYKAKTYSVMFYDDNMTKIGVTQNVAHGESAIVPTMSKQGYVFTGWKGGDPTNITEVSIFFAQYKVIQYNITFVFNDDMTENKTVKVDYGKTVDVIQPSDRGSEYTFIGWCTDATFSDKFDFNTVVTKDITLYACWEEKAPTVTFKIEGAIYQEQSVEIGDCATDITPPARYGYDFIGWFIEGTDTAFNFESPINEPVILEAKFETKSYNVTFYYGDGATEVVSVKHGEKVLESALPTNTDKTGYDFAGWNIEDILDRVITGDISVTANYTIKTYNISYVVDGGDVSTAQTPYNSYVQMISAPYKVGYTFLYWKAENAESAFDFATTRVSGDLTLVGVYKINTYKVYYYLNGELIKTDVLEQGAKIDLTTAPENIAENQVFLGWTARTDVINGADVVVTGELYTLREFTITYYINGTVYASVNLLEGEVITLIDAPTAEELNEYATDCVYTFNGWESDYEVMPAKNVAINANITTRYYYSLSYYLNGKLVAELKLLEGETVTPYGTPEIDGENIVFNGWKNEPEIMPAKNYRVDAEFKTLKEYNIYFYVNGELFDSVKVLETKVIPSFDDIVPTDLAENETFIGWKSPEGYEAMPEVMPASDLIINAELDYKQYYVISYYVNGVLYGSVTVMESANVTPYGEPEIDDERIIFNGWIDEPNVMPNENVTVNADIYVREYYAVNYVINGAVFYRVMVLEGEELPALPEVPAEKLPENVIFNGWESDYTVMPNRDIEIIANVTVKQYYKITYMLGDAVYNEATYVEGAEVKPFVAPQNLPAGAVFNGWLGEPAIMPSEDVIVYADITYEVSEPDKVNTVIVTGVNNADGSLTVTIEMDGIVNFAGIIGDIVLNAPCNGVDVATDDCAGYAYAPNGENIVKFVWSKGENVTEERTLIEFTVYSIRGDGIAVQDFNVQVYAFTENGEIVQVEFNCELN